MKKFEMWIVFLMGITIFYAVAKASGPCEVQVGFGEEFPGWANCPEGYVMTGFMPPNTPYCAQIQVTCP
jgi:hypothetical protein